MRLNKFLAHAGVASRRTADGLIQAATTSVNGRIVTDPAFDVSEKDEILFDGRRLSLIRHTRMILLHKPTGVITTTRDELGRRSVLDLVPRDERLFPVGRLDQDTTGLVLLTNDGELANRLAHPRWRIQRIYEAVIDRPLTKPEIQRLAKGMYIGEGEDGRADVLEQKTVKSRTTVILELRRGKKREIRRLFFQLKRKLFSLVRTQFGPVRLGDLPVGHWRELTRQELEQLKGKLNGH
ncbi:MAG: pseudouridine synthase [Candidatus Neomarinimicrobiota bacterium]